MATKRARSALHSKHNSLASSGDSSSKDEFQSLKSGFSNKSGKLSFQSCEPQEDHVQMPDKGFVDALENRPEIKPKARIVAVEDVDRSERARRLADAQADYFLVQGLDPGTQTTGGGARDGGRH